VSDGGRGFPWPAGSATGIGSMPGTNPDEAMAVVLGELPDLPHLAELPGRGPGADMVGRTAALLVDLPVETTPTGWRLSERPGRDFARAAGYLSADLDALEAATQGFAGPLKIQLCGPWTLAASLQLTRSIEPALSDPGAVADLTASLAEAAAAHVAAVRRRVPGAEVVVQLDEPALPGVLAGSVPTASGLRRLAAVDEVVAAEALRAVGVAGSAPYIAHCCARQVPFNVATTAGATAVSFDLALLADSEHDAIGELAERGLGILAGAVPALPSARPGRAARSRQDAARGTAAEIVELWQRIGLPASTLTEQVVVTPACGLAGASPDRARAVLAQCQAAGRMIPEIIEEGVR
jgi:Cobalamin-independent synthase, Catalytic domain